MFIGEPRQDARFSSGYATLNMHSLRMRMADPDPLLVDMVAIRASRSLPSCGRTAKSCRVPSCRASAA